MTGKGDILEKNNQKKYKKVVYEGESDSEPEVDKSEYLSEEIEEIEKPKPAVKKQQQQQQQKITFLST